MTLSISQSSFLDCIPLTELESYMDQRKGKQYNPKRTTLCIAQICHKTPTGDKTIQAMKCAGCNDLVVNYNHV